MASDSRIRTHCDNSGGCIKHMNVTPMNCVLLTYDSLTSSLVRVYQYTFLSVLSSQHGNCVTFRSATCVYRAGRSSYGALYVCSCDYDLTNSEVYTLYGILSSLLATACTRKLQHVHLCWAVWRI